MNPSEPAPPPEPQSDSQPKHKKVVVASIIIAVLVIIAVISAVLFTRSAIKEVVKQPDDPSLRINKPGYVNVHESIGDPFALIESTPGKAVAYQKKPVIDACNLLSLSDVTDEKLLINPSAGAGEISRHYFDGTSTRINKEWTGSEELIQDVNECDYPLVNDKGVKSGGLNIEVYQPEYTNAAGLRSVLDDYLRSSEVIDGAALYNRTNTPIQDERVFYFLENKGTYAALEFDVPHDDADNTIAKALRGRVAANLAAQLKQPTGPAMFDYKSQTFSGKYVSACSISSAVDTEALFKQPATPSIQEHVAPSTGIISYDGKKSNFVHNRCIRSTFGSAPTARLLTVETRAFESEDAAKAYLGSKKNDGSLELEEKVGNDGFFNMSDSPEHALYFRTGNTAVMVAANTLGDAVTAAEDYITAITPTAKTIEKRLATVLNPTEANDPAAPKPKEPAN